MLDPTTPLGELGLIAYTVFAGVAGVSNLGTPYLIACGAIALGLHPEHVVQVYVVHFVAQSEHEWIGTALSPATIGETVQAVPQRIYQHSQMKGWVLALFVTLPLPQPSVLTGWLAAGGALVALVVLRGKPWQTLVAIAAPGIGLALVYAAVQSSTTGVLGLMAGLFIPAMLWPDAHEDLEPTVEHLPNPIAVAVALVGNWVTPGLTTNALTSSLLGPSWYRPAVNSLIGAAIEGWTIQVWCRGGASGKTPLGDLFALGLEHSLGMIPIVVVIGVGFALLPRTWAINLPYPRLLACATLLTQAVVATGLAATLSFLAAGTIAQYAICRWAPGEGDARSWAFMIPLLFS